MEPQLMKDQVCDQCIEHMEDIIAPLRKSSAEEEVKSILREGCEKIRDQEISQHCQAFVDNEWSVTIKLLQEDVEFAVLCTALSLCQPLQVEPTPENVSDSVNSSPVSNGTGKRSKGLFPRALPAMTCRMCETFMDRLHAEWDRGRKGDVLMKVACQLPTDIPKMVCKKFVNSHMGKIKTVLENPEDRDLCGTELDIPTQHSSKQTLLAVARSEANGEPGSQLLSEPRRPSDLKDAAHNAVLTARCYRAPELQGKVPSAAPELRAYLRPQALGLRLFATRPFRLHLESPSAGSQEGLTV
ncbi:proactivator polypeptide-like 1 [Rhincodon typus]|uniref:proactivator polypeptide-like 1 n=1 Tax=Rhincodon typus TaxID=259920 RepID=UPI0020304116|nr:proactivator polypeptide-like 1 [Rhincodon typus]